MVSVYQFIDDLGNVSADNFHLETSIQVAFNDKWAICQAARIYIIGTDGAMIFPFSKLGCSSDNNLLLNDVYLNGNKHDLSAFSANLIETTSLELQVFDKKVSVLINGIKVYQNTYSESMGRLVGLRYKFLGLGEVKSLSIKDKAGALITLE